MKFLFIGSLMAIIVLYALYLAHQFIKSLNSEEKSITQTVKNEVDEMNKKEQELNEVQSILNNKTGNRVTEQKRNAKPD